MGNREDLLAGAKKCLYDKGYARTTARDIATAAGVSLAAIGYHYGTKEALLNAAVRQALEEWATDLQRITSARTADPAARFEAVWDGVIRSFADNRPLWSIQFELIGLGDPATLESFAAANHDARLALVELFGDFGHPDDALLLGTLYQALLAGVASQWLVDPASSFDGASLRSALALLTPPAPHDPTPRSRQDQG
jgi:AcrR family transcriptional regulator